MVRVDLHMPEGPKLIRMTAWACVFLGSRVHDLVLSIATVEIVIVYEVADFARKFHER